MSAARLYTLSRTFFNQDLYTRIHNLWFAGQPATATTATEDSSRRWFANPDKQAAKAFDDECRDICGPALESLSPSTLSLPPFTTWTDEHARSAQLASPLLDELNLGTDTTATTTTDSSSKTALAIFLLLDQIPRNIYRETQGRIYAHYDRLAQSLARSVLSSNPRLDLAPWLRDRPIMRYWFYLPLMHSEDLNGDHELLKTRITEMRAQVVAAGDEDAVKFVDVMMGFEVKHADILRKYGRYPYRNAALGRTNTPAEEEYERNGGERFSA